MKCKNCGQIISFKHYFIESLNPLKSSKHTCSNCGFEYKVNIFFWQWLVVLVMVAKSYKYYMWNTHFIELSVMEASRIFIIAAAIVYIIFIVEQIIYYVYHMIKPT